MDAFIDARFDQVEKALAALVESIAKYNPSTGLAESLLAADRALAAGLVEIQTHQNNYQRLLALRAQAAARDAQIRDTLQALATARRELLAAPTTTFPEDSPNDTVRRTTRHYDFTYDELMSYARRISRNTVPAPGQTDGAELYGTAAAEGEGGAGGGGGGGGGGGDPGTVPGTGPGTAPATAPGTVAATPAAMTPAPGVTPGGVQTDVAGTPAAATAVATTGGGGGGGGGETDAAAAAAAASTTVKLPPDYEQWIAPAEGTIFSPWPLPQMMQNGGLKAMSAARLPGGGVPPLGGIRFVSLEEQEAEEQQRAAREAEERARREARQRQMEEEAAAAAAAAAAARAGQRSHANGQSTARPAPTQFASTLDMDDDDD